MSLFSSVSRTLKALRSKSLLATSDKAPSDPKPTSSPKETYTPPPGPPPSKLPPIFPVELPFILPAHRYNLHDQGWSTITFPSASEPLYLAYRSLFAAAETFFDRDADYKSQFLTPLGSEEGWSRIEGEKEFITLRHTGSCPEELREPAERVWELAAKLLNLMLSRIEESLELSPNSLTAFSSPCSVLDATKRATMLRIFRYENWEPKIVAEPHADLGLLSLVIGDTPGLEVWNKYNKTWFPVERVYEEARVKQRDKEPKASVLVGRQLQRFSNGRYLAGGHLVRSYSDYGPSSQPSSPPEEEGSEPKETEKKYRFSIVFVLRAHWPVPVDTNALTSRITGPHAEPIHGETAGQLFTRIRKAHFNVNTGIKEREEQKRKVLEARIAGNGNVEGDGRGAAG